MNFIRVPDIIDLTGEDDDLDAELVHLFRRTRGLNLSPETAAILRDYSAFIFQDEAAVEFVLDFSLKALRRKQGKQGELCDAEMSETVH